MKKHLQRIRLFLPQRGMVVRRARRGQALVELALTLTLLVMLLGAAVDLGLAFKTYQTLTNATAEASTYLSLEPIVNCGSTTCDQIGPVNRTARERFRTEQGTTLRGSASTLDLDASGRDDEFEAGRGWSWIEGKVRIEAADSDQVTTTNSGFTLSSPFNRGSTNTACKDDRSRSFTVVTNALTGAKEVKYCYIVVQTEMIYKPFIIQPFVGSEMTITAISVKPIVGRP